jgi:hypothetical protein
MYFWVLNLEKIFAPVDPKSNFCIYLYLFVFIVFCIYLYLFVFIYLKYSTSVVGSF